MSMNNNILKTRKNSSHCRFCTDQTLYGLPFNNSMKKINIALFIIILLLSACAFHTEAFAGDKTGIDSKEELNMKGRRVGVGEGSASMLIAERELPNADIVYLDSVSGYEAVSQGKLDAFVFERMQMQLAIDSGLKGVKLLDENMDETIHIAYGISPKCAIPDFEGRLNEFIAFIKGNGTFDDMVDRWIVNNSEDMPNIDLPANPEYHLVVGTTGVVPPYSYYRGSELSGFDIEAAYRFASWLDADLEFKVYDYSGIIPAAAVGDVDCIMANLNITPERAEALIFSDSIFDQEVGILVRAADSRNEAPGFLHRLKAGFEKTFMREDRWSLFAKGILVTLLITVMSIVLGTVLGFILLMLSREGGYVINRLIGFCSGLILGLPVVVLLMVLYYIIFERIALSGIIVSIIGFTLTFGFTVYGLLKLGVSAIDTGQYEAAYALGHSRTQTFFRVILPQALPLVMDSYKGEITGLIKATAIVGYIAVQDLTKVGDIIRSRTYEAFFPLIAISLIYFMLEWMFRIAVNKLQKELDPREKTWKGLLRGVKINDQG